MSNYLTVHCATGRHMMKVYDIISWLIQGMNAIKILINY